MKDANNSGGQCVYNALCHYLICISFPICIQVLGKKYTFNTIVYSEMLKGTHSEK